jgi:hypothetical protein
MHPSAQRWCDMGKTTATATTAPANPVSDDLNAEGGSVAITVPENDVIITESGNGDIPEEDDAAEAEEPEYVVLKGNSVRHDGTIYPENTSIPVTGTDADRLLNAGVIADIAVLRRKILAAQPSVSVTSE